jgi:FHS family glucose/mannose:H+ symporter-like MFS transporter
MQKRNDIAKIEMPSYNRRLTQLGLGGYLFIGTAAVLLPSMMPSITDEFTAAGLTVAAIGLIFPARAAGGIVGNLLSGLGSDMLGRQRLVWLSALLLAASLILTAIATPWGLFIAGFALVSAAQGALSTGINAMVADANRQSRARMLNILHGVYGAGAALSPLIIGLLVDGGLAWRWALAGAGLIWLVYGIVAARFDQAEMPDVQAVKARQSDFSMLGKTPFLALFLVAFIYNGVAWSLLGWLALFMQQSAGLSTFFSVISISVFYVALTIGRFICAAFAERIGYARTLLVLAICVTLTYPLVVLNFNSTLAVAGVFLTGLGLSGLFPTAMAYGSRLYPDQTGTVSGTLNVAMTFGAMAPPFWTGIVAGMWNFQAALAVNYLMLLPLILIALYLGRSDKTLTTT